MKFKTNNQTELNVTFVNANTKKAESIISKYNNTTKGSSIYSAYERPSAAKVDSFNKILKEMNECGGDDMRITGAGSDIYSCAYKVHSEDNKKYLIYHTHVNRFAIPLE